MLRCALHDVLFTHFHFKNPPLPMRRFISLILLVLAAGSGRLVSAQKIIEKSSNLAPGQRVFLNLRQASTIHIRSGRAAKSR